MKRDLELPRSQSRRKAFLAAAMAGQSVQPFVRAKYTYREPQRFAVKARSPQEIANAMMNFAESGMSRKRYAQVMRRETQVKDAT